MSLDLSIISEHFSESILSRIAHSLDRGEMPLKYNYLIPAGAKAWSEIENARTNSGNLFKDSDLLVTNVDLYLRELGNPTTLRLIDFGAGSGDATKPFVEKLISRGIDVSYYPLDISPVLLDQSGSNIASILGTNRVFPILQDFEDGTMADTIRNLSSSNSIPILGVFIGSTVGNFKHPINIIDSMMDGLGMKDRLIIGVQRSHLDNSRWIESLLREYNTKNIEGLTAAVVRSINIDPNMASFSSIYNQSFQQIEFQVTFEKNAIFAIEIHIFILRLERGFFVEFQKNLMKRILFDYLQILDIEWRTFKLIRRINICRQGFRGNDNKNPLSHNVAL